MNFCDNTAGELEQLVQRSRKFEFFVAPFAQAFAAQHLQNPLHEN